MIIVYLAGYKSTTFRIQLSLDALCMLSTFIGQGTSTILRIQLNLNALYVLGQVLNKV